MKLFWILLSTAAVIVLLILALAYVCFYITFYVPKKRRKGTVEFDLPTGKIYEPYHGRMIEWMKVVRAMPHEDMSVVSFDGLRLYGKYYEYEPGAPIELMFHGYRGTAERDLCGGVQRCFSLGRNVLLVDQRGGGRSEGNVITFGIKESRDCLTWAEHLVDRFGPQTKIILTGISMGAATVLMAAGKPLPKNVVGILADCGYTSPREIIKKVIRQRKLPENLLYPFVRLGARLFGRFDPDEASPLEAMKRCSVPVIFIHGESDDYVPCGMSRTNHEACAAPKKLLTVPNAGHGLSYLVDADGYLSAVAEFFSPMLNEA